MYDIDVIFFKGEEKEVDKFQPNKKAFLDGKVLHCWTVFIFNVPFGPH